MVSFFYISFCFNFINFFFRYNHFSFLKDNQSAVFAHANLNAAVKVKPKLGSHFSKIPIVFTTLNEPDNFKAEFNKLITNAYASVAEGRRDEENQIMN